MVSGDVVNGISAVNTSMTFQPAAGVEIAITSAYCDSSPQVPQLATATLNATLNSIAAAMSVDIGNMKMMINNTIFLLLSAGGAGVSTGYTGIQIK